LIYDAESKFFYRKGDFPLLIDPAKYPMKKIFISYSKSDVKYRDEFKKHFYPLKRQSKIDTFDDSDLGFGEWNPQILKKIEECDIFVCLVSIDFLNTDYIINTEIPHAIKHEKTIIPIKIRECDWSDFLLEHVNEKGEKELNLKLGAYNASLKAKTISLFSEKDNYFDKRINTVEERDAVWTELVNQYKKKLNL
jgi:internalin A